MVTDAFVRIQIHLFAICVCLAMLVDTQKQVKNSQYSFRLFRSLLIVCMLLLGTEAASWYTTGSWKFLWNTACFSLHAVPGYLFSLYVDFQLGYSESELRRYQWRLLPLVLSESLVLYNLLVSPILFSVRSDGLYYRESLFVLETVCSYSYMIYTFFRVCQQWNQQERSLLQPLILFHLIPVIGVVAQILLYGTGFAWPSVALALLVCYIYIQNRQIGTDYLTSANNRLQVDRQLHRRLHDAPKQPFSALMIDIDNFKGINDTHGHLVGDEALIQTVQILRQLLRRNDFLARYGGDEFLILTDNHTAGELDGMAERIRQKFDHFNQHSGKPYQLTLSIGHAVFDPQSQQAPEEFLAMVDERMYAKKHLCHEE